MFLDLWGGSWQSLHPPYRNTIFLSSSLSPISSHHITSHQGIRAVGGQNRNVDRRRVIGHTEAAIGRPVLGIVKLDLGGQRARNQDERELGSQVVKLLAPLLHRHQPDHGERGHSPSHLCTGPKATVAYHAIIGGSSAYRCVYLLPIVSMCPD